MGTVKILSAHGSSADSPPLMLIIRHKHYSCSKLKFFLPCHHNNQDGPPLFFSPNMWHKWFQIWCLSRAQAEGRQRSVRFSSLRLHLLFSAWQSFISLLWMWFSEASPVKNPEAGDRSCQQCGLLLYVRASPTFEFPVMIFVVIMYQLLILSFWYVSFVVKILFHLYLHFSVHNSLLEITSWCVGQGNS